MHNDGGSGTGFVCYWRGVALLIVLCVAAGFSVKSEAAEVEWAIRAGGGGADKIRGLAMAKDGGIFLTGEFGHPSADFLGENVNSAGMLDFVVMKLDPDGSLQWMATAGGAKIDRGYGVAPADDGGCFVTGHFESKEIDFGNEQVLKNQGEYDAFVVRYDPAGKCLWAFGCGGAGYDYGHGIDVDHKGGCVVSGAFAATGNFGDTKFEHAKGRRAFLLRIAADGDIRWVREAGAASDSGTMSGHNVCCDVDGNIFMAGFQRGGADFSKSVSLPESTTQDVFVARYDLEGDPQWAVGTGGKADGLATSVAPDGSGGCYIAGMFRKQMRLAGKAIVSEGEHDVYSARIDGDGKGVWLHQSGGAGTDYGLGLAVAGDGSDGCLMTGELTGEGKVRGTGRARGTMGKGKKDAFVAGYSKSGELVLIEFLGGKDSDLSYAIGADPSGTVVIAGAFRNETKMGAIQLKSRRGNDIFVTKLKTD